MTQSAGRGYAIGALFMTAFGAVWALAAISAASGSSAQLIVGFAVVATITIGLLVPTRALWRAAGLLPPDTPEGQAAGQRRDRLFNVVFLIQGAAIGLTVLICVSTDHTEFIPPLIAIIVGVHFLPLAALFQMPLYYATAGLMIVIPVMVMLALSESREIGEASVWLVIPMVGSAIVLWLTAAGVGRLGRLALRG